MTDPAAKPLGPSPLAIDEDSQRSVDDARAAIHAVIEPVGGMELVALSQAAGRVLAADVVSTLDVPAHDNSAVDGYAFAGTELAAGGRCTLRVIGTLHAGAPHVGKVRSGECLRIMTGAVMPEGCDTVVPQELCEVDGSHVRFDASALRAGENRRRRGEDLTQGRAVLHAGRVLRPADLGLAASIGFRELAVRPRLRVALFSTGDEIQQPGVPLAPGCVYDSNSASLAGALQRLGCEVIDLGLVRDDPAALRATLRQAMAVADAVVTSGGVSVGDADHTRSLLAELGDVAFWKVAMRPGRPFAFGPLRRADRKPCWLFALPGNPVAALVAFYVFTRDALLVLGGARAEPLVTLSVPSAAAIRKRPGRTEFQRGIVRRGADGAWEAHLTGSQGAGVLRSMSEANALIVLGHDQASVEAGAPVTVWLFDGLA